MLSDFLHDYMKAHEIYPAPENKYAAKYVLL